ncbi:MAG TPA: MauE/DoxX family redox-associated membrane protein, partial [Xanthobacteraceae bacterium]|nr:MauE/DoxX family redox-associated membrane protein [Xanthobacteraceae bacterium]
FSLRDETIQMIPGWIPDKPMVATATGMIEVAIGVLFLVPQARRWAAYVSLGLLALYILAIYQILANDQLFSGNLIFQTAFRVCLIPNNIFLAICSVYLLQHPDASLAGSAGPDGKASSSPAWTNSGLAILLVAGLLLMSNCAGFLAIIIGASGQRATASLWAMMCIATGALIGFLFAVPRVNPQVRSNAALVINTNIEQVSDWLTKILVGVGLINFKEIAQFLDRLSGELAPSLGTEAAPVGKPFALSLIGYFFVVGLIQGYLLTRLFLSRYFEPDPAETTSTPALPPRS